MYQVELKVIRTGNDTATIVEYSPHFPTGRTHYVTINALDRQWTGVTIGYKINKELHRILKSCQDASREPIQYRII